MAIGRLLTKLVLVEANDAGVGVEQRTRVLSGHVRLAIRLLAGVRWRTEIDVHAALPVEGEPFVGVLPTLGQIQRDGLHLTRRFQLTRGKLVAHDARRRRVVDVAVAQPDARRAPLAELLLLTTLAPRAGRIVELKFFGGLTTLEIGEVLQLSPATVERDWSFARAWLYDPPQSAI